MRAETIILVASIFGCGPGHLAESPPPVLRLKTDWQPVIRYLDSAVAGGASPGAVLAVSHDGERFVYGTGILGDLDASRPDGNTIYDLASLTKVVGLTTGMMLAVEEGKVELDAPVRKYIPGFIGPDKEKVTLRMLLAHAAGLPAWRPLYREVSTRDAAFALADTTPLEYPPGSRDEYSDLGAILLTQVLESVYGQRIDSLLEQRIFGPLGLTSLRYLPPATWSSRIAPTEMDPWRGRVLRGEVHDENAAIMDGVSGHAGLFGSAEDLLGFAEWVLGQADGSGGPPAVQQSVFSTFTSRQNLPPGSTRALGWDTPDSSSSSGTKLSPHSIGHTGFTGSSIWIDLDRRVAIVLLSNRVHPTRNNPRWNPVRAAVADLVMTTLFEDVR